MLTFESLEQWQRWQRRQQGMLRRLRSMGGAGPRLGVYASLLARENRPVVVALDSLSPSQRASLVRPAEVLMARGTPVVVIAPENLAHDLGPLGLSPIGTMGRRWWSDLGLEPPRSVLSAGHYMAAGRAGWELAESCGASYLVVQHGLLTPHAPPLPSSARLLAWSDADGRFWSSGRADVATTVVGSQALWEARRDAVEIDPRAPLCFLGQLHGAELPRAVTRRTVEALRADGPFTYRPHPVEQDWQSRLQHRLWQRQGVAFSDRRPLLALRAPVGAVFSTGILEAAAAGLPAYGVCERPPAWVRELWDRYEIEQPGTGRTTRVRIPSLEPAQAVADVAESSR